MLPNFTRATTDNDRGGMELVLDFLHLKWAKPLLQGMNNRLFSYEMHWRDHGVSQEAPPSVKNVSTNVLNDGFVEEGDVKIEARISIESSTGTTLMTERKIYTITKNGLVHVDIEVNCAPSLDGIPSLPRIGQTFSLRESFNRVKFFGRGPGENYPDRKEGSKVGTWSAAPSEMGYNYIVPSENGSRSDCRWASFESHQEKLIVLGDSNGNNTFSFSALLHTSDDLQRASHTNDLEQRIDGKYPVHVMIDHRQMGLGGDLRYDYECDPPCKKLFTDTHYLSPSWFPCVYPCYLVKPRIYSYSFWLILARPGESAELAVIRARTSIARRNDRSD